MLEPKPQVSEETLDPTDWEAFKGLAHQMVDEMLSYLENVRERPVWQPIPDEVKQQFTQAAPQQGQAPATVYEDFQRYVLDYPLGNIHPRFWAWVIGTGTPLGMMAEMLAAGMNPNAGGGDHVATYVESQVIDWCKEMLGYPASASGILVSGGSMANLVGLTVARNRAAGFDVRSQGLEAAPQPLRLYASKEAHSSIQKGVELLGLGSQALRKIPVNDEFQIDLAALEEAIAADRAAGFKPFCVVGNAGTVNTGAYDDLNALADLCQREKLWYHVDGAFGAIAALSPELRPLTAGMERADSLAFDLHKWMYVPYEAGCALVRNAEDHRLSFTLTPEYLAHTNGGAGGGSLWFSDYGVELSRGFKSLKVWMSMKEHGLQKYGRMVRQNVEQARYLASLVDAAPDLERLAPVPLNIVCFRYRVPGWDDEALNELNRKLLVRLHESGIAVPSYTTLDGKYALRAAITNHRSRMEDFEILVRAVQKLGEELCQ